MKVEKVREKDGKLELLVELSPAETAEEMQRAAGNEIAKRGAGKDDLKASGVTPSEFLANLVGASEASFLIDEGIMRRRAPFALTAERVDTIGAPVYRCSEHAQIGKPFKYQLVCVPVPEYELESYDPVSISVPSYEVKTEEIDAEIDRMVQFAATGMTDTSHDEVMKGDKVELAMQTTMDGAPVKTLCTDGREYTTGAFAMPDDFDEAIIGMKVGETKTFGFEGPDIVPDADGNVKMDSYETTVTVKRIIKSVAPEPDDAWARSTKPGIESLEQLRAEVEEKIRSQHEDDFQRSAQMLAGNELAKRIVGDIPDLIYGVAMKEARENLNWKLQSENQTLDEFLAAQGMTQEELSNALMLQVRTQLNRQFAMNAYAKHKGLVVEEDDLNAFFESIAPGNANIAHADFNRDGRIYAARCAALRLKAAKRAVEEADITRIGAAS